MAETGFENQEIIARLKGQDHAAFNQLVRHYHYPLLNLASGIAGDHLAEEIVQDAWISVFRALPGFEARSSLKTWLYTIVRNECFGRLKKERRKPEVDATTAPDQDPLDAWYASSFAEDGHWNYELSEWSISSPEALLQEEQLQHCIEHTLELLKPDQKAVFELRELQQMPMEEVCNILDISHSNARVLLHRARLTLLQVIERYQETGEC